MTRLLRGTVVLLAAAAAGALIDWGPVGGFTSAASAKPGKGKGEKMPKKGKDHLQKTYEALIDVANARPPRELAPLVEQAKDLYRDAVRAERSDEPRRSDELEAAAHDAARGLVHALRADAPAVKGIPLPPPRDEYELADLLERTRDRLEDFRDVATQGAGHAFYDAARRLYDQARRAGREDSARALQLARAAEAWTHVGEHLDNADQRVGARREPPRFRERPVPPDDRPRRPLPPARD